MNDRLLNRPELQAAYKLVPPLDPVPRLAAAVGRRARTTGGNQGAVRVVGQRVGKGGIRSLMHHKFFVGLTAKTQAPSWVATGSYNASEGAKTNLENLMVIRSPKLAALFYDEFCRIHAVSKPLKAPATKAKPRSRKPKLKQRKRKQSTSKGVAPLAALLVQHDKGGRPLGTG
eukprot:m.12091 g.12091  ORF g.12091 m.12091 type:complete len:173 (+) comp4176_c0_seq1:604-1122(+)